MRYRFGELFCGAGGLSLGASLAQYKDDSIQPVWAIDNNKDACVTHKANVGGAIYCQDVREVDFLKLPAIDCLAFGFPCNDFSKAGKQKGLEGSYGGLYLECARALKCCRPLWFIAENVGGLKSANGGTALQVCIKAFEDCGYTVYKKLIDFSHLGVPQKRERFIFYGVRNDQRAVPVFPDESLYKDIDISSKTALTVPPISLTAANNERKKISATVATRLSYIPAGGNGYSAAVPEKLQLNARVKFSNSYRRLDPDKPSHTVVASTGGGNTVYHWSENRALTNRELARLQSFPDSFTFYGNTSSVKRMIGMAVPPAGARILIEQLLKAFH